MELLVLNWKLVKLWCIHTVHLRSYSPSLLLFLVTFSLSSFPGEPFSGAFYISPPLTTLNLWRVRAYTHTSMPFSDHLETHCDERKEHKKGLELIYLYHPFRGPSKPRSLLCKTEMVGLVCWNLKTTKARHLKSISKNLSSRRPRIQKICLISSP